MKRVRKRLVSLRPLDEKLREERRINLLLITKGLDELQKHLLHVLAARFVLQHDVLEYADAKRANDRDRYEGYGNMLRVLTEADPPHRLTDIPSAGIVESDRGVRAFIAVCTAALPHASPVRPPCCHFLALNHFRAL